ncbi:hypothetical protein GCM10023261_16750 [Bartonella jaculi]|uniref:Uncharacterized protein n=1 Tax=Bartonella jaculi TaxID=686226 RepID=A0ABP9N8Y6_9HYPH
MKKAGFHNHNANECIGYKDSSYKRLLNCKCVIKEINNNLKNHLVKNKIRYKDKNTHDESVYKYINV